jgi:hypothetical protein
MKKLLCLIISGVGLSAWALPTYEPFNEYSNLVPTGSSVDLAASGFYVTNDSVVEQWGGGDSGFGLLFSQGGGDVLVTNTGSSVFTSANLASVLPSGFPGADADIDITAFLPQNQGANTAGNSAVLKFGQDIPRPTNGVTTIFVSYLLDVTGNFNKATGANAGRYAGFLSQSNLYEGTGSDGSYVTWASMFNTFGSGPNYIAYGEATNKPAVAGGNGDNICPADSSAAAGGSGCAGTKAFYNTPNFVVGCFTFNSGGVADTNTVWLNPPLGDFGGPTPSANNVSSYTMGTVMSDVDGFFLESRSGGATGGIGPTFIGNLLIGHTWSYVTGGPEFTLQPAAVASSPAGDASLNGTAVAAGQVVTYQWIHIVNGVTNVLTDGVGTAGGGATVSGSTNSTLSLLNLTSQDIAGSYELVAQAGGTGFFLDSRPATVLPAVNTNPTDIVVLVSAGHQLTVNWPADHVGWQLQVQTNSLSTGLSGNWSGLSGSTTTNQVIVPIDIANGTVFFRLVYPPQ